MRRSRQLLAESAVIAGVLIMITLGGSVATTAIPPSFMSVHDPSVVTTQYDLGGVAAFYNATLTYLGQTRFANASFLLTTFRFVNIPAGVNGTAQAANADLLSVNNSESKAVDSFTMAATAINQKEYINATSLVAKGCIWAKAANSSLADFQGPQTSKLGAESVPTSQYQVGSNLASSEIRALLGECASLTDRLPSSSPNGGPVLALVIDSSQKTIETGGQVDLVGNLTVGGKGVAGSEVLFYINGTYFQGVKTNSDGAVGGTLSIPFIYFSTAVIQALVAPNSTARLGGAQSNLLYFKILFNGTAITIGDPPAYTPTSTFNVHGSLTSGSRALPDAPVEVTFLRDSIFTSTSSSGGFGATFVVPANATDGTYNVTARFAARGAYGPSVNFTSIEVVHLQMNLTLSVPSLSWAGFSATVSGIATSHGNPVSGAAVAIDSPWGTVPATTDQSGRFTASIPISPLEFSFSRSVAINVNPSQPYIAARSFAVSLGLFNVLVVVIPGAVVGIGAFEAERLGAFGGMRRRFRQHTGPPFPRTAGQAAVEVAAGGLHEGPEPLQFLDRALALASTRFTVRFTPGQTIREMLAVVRGHTEGEELESFSRILFAAEDFLYSPTFSEARVVTARQDLADLEAAWR